MCSGMQSNLASLHSRHESQTKRDRSMNRQPTLGFWQIWNMCFGFMGIQFGFALQNANVSRIFQTLGADYNDMTILWVAGPLTGLVVQPIIGYLSDNTWTRLGRRRPYFLIGAVLASLSLVVMPNSPVLWMAAGTLWVMDASINVAMEPFRALVGDMLPPKQRSLGFAMQSFFIGVGAVVASSLPWMMSNWFDVSNTADAGVIPDSVKYAFYAGGAIFLLAVLWTICSTEEYSPEQLEQFQKVEDELNNTPRLFGTLRTSQQFNRGGLIWFILGLALTLIVDSYIDQLDRNLYILSIGITVFGLLQLMAAKMDPGQNGFIVVMQDLFDMPTPMKKLAVVQFFSWFPFFVMWTSTTAAVTAFHYGTSDTSSVAFNQGADWVGVLFSVYNVSAVFAAITIPLVSKVLSLRTVHMVNLWLGGLGFASFVIIRDPIHLIVPMIGVGFAWASILSIPYALLSNVIPFKKMGVYMGIFNFFIVLPQILAASILGLLVSSLFNGEVIYALLIAGCSMFVAGLMTLRVDQPVSADQ